MSSVTQTRVTRAKRSVVASRRIAFVELASAYALLELALWTEGLARIAWSLLAAAWIAGAALAHRPTLRELGLGREGWRESARVAALGVAAALVIVACGWWAGTLHVLPGRGPVLAHSAAYVVWSLAQQFIAQSFFFLRLERLLAPRRAVVANALLFAAAHLPSPVLTLATLGGGLLFTEAFRRWRNIYPLAVAHAAVGLAIATAVSDTAIRHMRVGIGWVYFPH